MCGGIHSTLRKETRKVRLKFYKAMAVPVYYMDLKTLVSTKKIKNQIQTSEMKFLRRTDVYKRQAINRCKVKDITPNLDYLLPHC